MKKAAKLASWREVSFRGFRGRGADEAERLYKCGLTLNDDVSLIAKGDFEDCSGS